MQQLSKDVPTQKWVRLMYQIVSRLGGEDSTTGHNAALAALVVRTATDHPHHCAPLLIALRNANGYEPAENVRVRGQAAPGKSSRRGSASPSVVISKGVAQSKIVAAKKVLQTMSKQSCALVYNQWEQYVSAHVTLAAVAKSLKEKKRARKDFPKYLAEAAGPFLSTVPVSMVVPTLELAVRADCDYSNAPRVDEYDRGLKVTTSGITYPIIVKSRDNKGRYVASPKYRYYTSCESFSQFDSLPLTYLAHGHVLSSSWMKVASAHRKSGRHAHRCGNAASVS